MSETEKSDGTSCGLGVWTPPPRDWLEYKKEVGEKILILLYSLGDSGVPFRIKVVAMRAMGYFLLPFNLLPGNYPRGFYDGMTALSVAVEKVMPHLSPGVLARAQAREDKWFGKPQA